MQRDLLPLIEGTTVDEIRAGQDRPHPVHRLGAFPHRQAFGSAARIAGPLPIRVELRALTEDFIRILTETGNALTRQYNALMATEGVEVSFTEDGMGRWRGSRPR